jgi:hypothetical protein
LQDFSWDALQLMPNHKSEKKKKDEKISGDSLISCAY